jgi:hypothetical protein
MVELNDILQKTDVMLLVIIKSKRKLRHPHQVIVKDVGQQNFGIFLVALIG